MAAVMKNPWLAALLNVIPLGFGYLYIRRYPRFWATFFVGAVASLVGVLLGFLILLPCMEGPCSGARITLSLIVLFSFSGVVAALTAWDVWHIVEFENWVTRDAQRRAAPDSL